MRQVVVHFGGAGGSRHPLRIADEYLAVRTHRRLSLRRSRLGSAARAALAGFELVTEFHEAGVQLFRCRARARRPALRDQARRLLRREEDVRFAGRVLCHPVSRAPVVYTENLFVKFVDRETGTACRRRLGRAGLRIKRPLAYAPNAFFVGAPDGAGLETFAIAERLLEEPAVELCHPEVVRERGLRAAAPEQWHLRRTRIDGRTVNQHAHVVEAWRLSRGAGVVIAVIDDGVDVEHREFAGAGKIVAPRDVTRSSDDPRPKCSEDHHGTACAGVACAQGRHRAAGVAPRAALMPIRNVSALGSQDEADSIYWAASRGADVISCSWGPPDGAWWDTSDPLHRHVEPLPDSTRLALDWAVEHGRGGRGCVITFAAGNGNESVDNDGYASYPKVIAVAACNDRGKRSVYSDHGEALWCCFPSSDDRSHQRNAGIWTTDRTVGAGYNCGGPFAEADRAGSYTSTFGGTSSACPGAAGVAALVIARNPKLRWDEVKDVLRRCCDKIDREGGRYRSNGHSRRYGYGRLNARRAIELADSYS